MEIIVPKHTTVPNGDHRALFPNIIGITPIDAAAEVRNIGRILRRAEWQAASNTDSLFFILNSSA